MSTFLRGDYVNREVFRSRSQVVITTLHFCYLFAVFLNCQTMSFSVVCLVFRMLSPVISIVVNFILETTGNVMLIKVKNSGCLKVN